MNKTEERIYAMIADEAPPGGALVADQRSIAATLGVDQSNVCRALKRLDGSGKIIRVQIGGKVSAYALGTSAVKDAENGTRLDLIVRARVEVT